MCGIVGYAGGVDTLDVLLSGLRHLEYRGYDSAGVALGGDDATAGSGVDRGLAVRKSAGDLDALVAAIGDDRPSGRVGIGHTRWSTHGPPTDRNAHPHTDADGRVAVVHNGIIENYRELREELEERGVTFVSDTDTEVVPHLLATYLDAGMDPEAAFRRAVGRLEGSYAIAAVVDGVDAVFGARQESPLVLGVDDDGGAYLASDVPAFVDRTQRVVYLEEGQVAVLRPDGWAVSELDGTPVDPPIATVPFSGEATGKAGFDHYMEKEIHEQPTALRQCIRGRIDDIRRRVTLDDLPSLGDADEVQFVACGTSYHASLYAAMALRERGVRASAHLASEYASMTPPVSPRTLVVGVTQSGETADTLSALRAAIGRNARTLAMTNVVASSAARLCDHALYIRAGPEISVAATKSFSSQLATGLLLVEHLTGEASDPDLLDALSALPTSVQQTVDGSNARTVVGELAGAESYFFIGRGYDYPVALEGALKCKEITYEHAEGFAAGELKHGPLALVSEETPVFAVVTGHGDRARKTIGNVKEVQARGAPVVAVTDGAADVADLADYTLSVSGSHERTTPLLANVQLQLVAYHLAASLGRSIDRPRNLAKSVTVQ